MCNQVNHWYHIHKISQYQLALCINDLCQMVKKHYGNYKIKKWHGWHHKHENIVIPYKKFMDYAKVGKHDRELMQIMKEKNINPNIQSLNQLLNLLNNSNKRYENDKWMLQYLVDEKENTDDKNVNNGAITTAATGATGATDANNVAGDANNVAEDANNKKKENKKEEKKKNKKDEEENDQEDEEDEEEEEEEKKEQNKEDEDGDIVMIDLDQSPNNKNEEEEISEPALKKRKLNNLKVEITKLKNENIQLKEENNKLKEENNKLKKENNQLQAILTQQQKDDLITAEIGKLNIDNNSICSPYFY
jgi:FtsZ-binding cell division protein ZapB